MPLGLFVAIVLLLPALGILLVKPSVVGTTARASKENVRSIGYSIYYTMVNIGGTIGPVIADWAHAKFGVENVFRIAALSVFAMVFFVLFFFREPKTQTGAPPPPSLSVTAKNFITVLSNPKFMLFLLIFTGYWVVFWQQFTLLPGYIHNFIDPNARVERVLSIDAAVVIEVDAAIDFHQCIVAVGLALAKRRVAQQVDGAGLHLQGVRRVCYWASRPRAPLMVRRTKPPHNWRKLW